jgi:hypothetical protein
MLMRIVTMACMCTLLAATVFGAVVPDQKSKQQVTLVAAKGKRKAKTATLYRKMTDGDLTVEALPWANAPEAEKRDNCFLRVLKKDSYHFTNRTYVFGKGRNTIEDIPEEFVGRIGFITQLEKYSDQSVNLSFSKPVRVYALINWWWTSHKNEELGKWTLYHRDHISIAPIFYRDFPAGKHALNFFGDQVMGMAIVPRDDLSSREKIVPVGRILNDRPVLEVSSTYAGAKNIAWSYEVVDPGTGKTIDSGKKAISVTPGKPRLFQIDTARMKPGTMYYIKNKLTLDGTTWSPLLPYGKFPVPPADASVQEPILPYGAYNHLPVNFDPEIYNHFLSAFFYQLRVMKMNCYVAKHARKDRMDLAAKYKIKSIVRLGNTKGKVQHITDGVVGHPSMLTYMIGDEPKLGEKMDNHVKLYEILTKRYPKYEPISCTIYDSYGTGQSADPVLIHHLLKKYKFQRFGRYYCFRKDFYGLRWQAEYKGMLPVESVFQGLEADKEKSWWLAPPFFGLEPTEKRPTPYWRIPTGTELVGLSHMALAHRCSGLIGWGTHTHARVTSAFFEGRSMTKTKYWVGDDMAKLGAKLMKGKSVILNFTTARIPVFWREPMDLDVTARWLANGMFAVYVTNMDIKKAHNGTIKVYIGADKAARRELQNAGTTTYNEIAALVDVYTGKKIAYSHESKTVHFVVKGEKRTNRKHYLVIKTGDIPPGDGMLILAKAKTKSGGFSAKPKNLKASQDAAADIQVDF